MRSIKRRLEKERVRTPNGSSYLWFARAVMGRKFSRPVIARQFRKLVEGEDYLPSERKAIVDYLVILANSSVAKGFRDKNRQGKVENR